jgi:hypothetical protein
MNAFFNTKVIKTRKEEIATPVYWYSQQLLHYVVSQKWPSYPVTLIETEIQQHHWYPDSSKSFHLVTDASDHQFGAVMMQDKMSITVYSRNLNTVLKQFNYILVINNLMLTILQWSILFIHTLDCIICSQYHTQHEVGWWLNRTIL